MGLNRIDRVGRDGLSQAVVGRIHVKSRSKHNWQPPNSDAWIDAQYGITHAYAPRRLNRGEASPLNRRPLASHSPVMGGSSVMMQDRPLPRAFGVMTEMKQGWLLDALFPARLGVR